MAARRTDPKYIAVLALASVAILVAGAVIRTSVPQGEAAPAAVAPDLLQLERIAQRRDVELIADYFDYVAAQVENSVVLLGGTGQSGVVWRAGEVVTASRLGPFPPGDSTALASREVELTTRAASPHLPFVLLQAPPDAAASGRTEVRLYGRGAWLLAAWRSREGGLRYASGNLFGVANSRCGGIDVAEVRTNLDYGSVQPGAGVFSLDGSLIAVVLPCAGRMIAAEVAALEALARSEPTLEERLMARFGMRVASADAAERAFFARDAGGVIVRETWWGYRAHQAGLMPGDILLSLDGADVGGLEDLQALLLPVSREVHQLRILRADRRRSVRLLARAATAPAAAQHGFVSDDGGLAVGSVLRGSLAEQAGARPGDRVLAVNQRPASSLDDLDDAFAAAAGDPLHIVLKRHGRIWGALVPSDE